MMQASARQYFWTLFSTQVAHAKVTLRQSCPKFRFEMIFSRTALGSLTLQLFLMLLFSLSHTSSSFSRDFPWEITSLLMFCSKLMQFTAVSERKAREKLKSSLQWKKISMARKPETKTRKVGLLLNFPLLQNTFFY